MLSILLLVLTVNLNTFNQTKEYSLVNVNQQGVMLNGYDVVAYFTENKPVKGTSAYASFYQHATYHFTSIANKQLFDGNPDKYVPKYGGYCAVAAAFNKMEEIEIDKFQIYQGHLYMNRNAKAVSVWNENPAGIVKKAEKNWPKLKKKYGKLITN